MDLRQQSLKTIFIKYFLTLIVSMLLVVVLVGVSMNFLMRIGLILPANYDEKMTYALKEQLERKQILEPSDFEGKCRYAFFDAGHQLIQTNIEELDGVRQYLEGDRQLGKYYVTIRGSNGYAVIEYELEARYNSPFLTTYLPSVEGMYLCILLGAIVLAVLGVSNQYGRKLKSALEPLEKAVRAIGKQNLDFEIERSPIKEFDEIGKSMNAMQMALQESLKNQWELERQKREQMAALAHDIKTPLTIIKGSIDLLEEEGNLNEQQQALSTSIKRSSDKVQEYIQLVMEIAHEGNKMQLHKQPIEISVFLNKVIDQVKQLAQLENISILLELPKEEIEVEIDTDLMTRAVMNIVSNGIAYTPPDKSLMIRVEKKEATISIQVIDEGIGFTEEAIQRGCELFYRGDQSRHQKGHYGMGLYIARQIIVKHNGSLKLNNYKQTKGGEVTINLPCL